MHRHKDLAAGVPAREKRKILFNALRDHENDVALAIIWLLIDPVKYKPLLDEPFASWATIPTTLEFDHKGTFDRVLKIFWRYEGAEPKSSFSGKCSLKLYL
jgi:hypothetical protein